EYVLGEFVALVSTEFMRITALLHWQSPMPILKTGYLLAGRHLAHCRRIFACDCVEPSQRSCGSPATTMIDCLRVRRLEMCTSLSLSELIEYTDWERGKWHDWIRQRGD